MSQQTESASEMLRKLIAAVEKAHTSLFAQCCSNPIKNAWGKEVSVTALNDAEEMAVSFSAALRNKQSAAQALTDARILEIAMGHFKPGHTVAAEKNFLACVHDILAQAAAQPSEDKRDLAQVVEDAGGWGAETERFLIAQEDKRDAERFVTFVGALVADANGESLTETQQRIRAAFRGQGKLTIDAVRSCVDAATANGASHV